MTKYNHPAANCEAVGPTLPSGVQAGRYFEEHGLVTWERSIASKHILRFLDAFTINEGLLRQIQERGVDLIRYKLAAEGTYETSLSSFLQSRAFLPGFAAGEHVYALPRDQWDFQTTSREPSLFDPVGQPA